MSCLDSRLEKNMLLFSCNYCGQCSDFIETKNYLNKNRGCCWYFPKYSLMDLKNILQSNNEVFLKELVKNYNVNITDFNIEVIGLFKEDAYNLYMQENDINNNFDERLYFRLCPFVGDKGCKITFDLRPRSCNLYLCREVISACGEKYKRYSSERKSYYAYCNYYDEVIKDILLEYNINLKKNFEECIYVIKEIEIPLYENTKLEQITFDI